MLADRPKSRLVIGISGQNDVQAAGKWTLVLGNRFPGLAAHDDCVDARIAGLLRFGSCGEILADLALEEETLAGHFTDGEAKLFSLGDSRKVLQVLGNHWPREAPV